MRAAYCGERRLFEATAQTGWPSTQADLIALRHLARDLALEGGRFVRDERPDRVDVAQTKASDLDVVTEMDTRCEDLIRHRLAVERPQDAVLGEEGGLSVGSSGLTWVIDPIDGTVNYLYDLPAYSVSVAVVIGDPHAPGAWTPVAGAVCNPRVDEIFHAHAGGRARWEATGELAVDRARDVIATAPTGLHTALVGTGFSYDVARRSQQGQVATALLPQVRDLRRMGSAALDLCSVAAGRLDAYYERGVQPWDMAAGALIAAQAGAVVSGLAGPASADMVVCAHPDLQFKLEDALRKAGG